jgi:serine/threonine protein kinase/tetratricopeptide (TPR) repeat protein
MKHFSPGLSDSIASVIADPAQCPHCDSSSCIGGGLCVGCLLQAGLAADEECAPETLLSALAEITLPDKNWRLGNYEILEEIGRGGMGVIYRARQRHSRRIVAVKRVLGYHADSRETLARFRREAQAAASLDHPNILPIYEVSESEDGLPFFSMKFAPGGNLQEVGPALRNDPRQCVALVAKIARAVQHAHGKGILHRDLKPGNILLDAHGEPLVSDFGLAKWLDTTSDLTRTLTIFGTPGYIAPEQASGPAAQLKPAADVYSLGAILFDLLAGRPPFLGSHALSVIRQAAETTAPKLRSLSKVADRDLETICARCLEREPSARYPSAHDLAEDLERWLEGRPIIARPVSPPVKAWRWSKRNRKLASAIATALVLGGIGATAALTSSRLSSIIQNAELARHSIALTPFEEIDNLSTTSNTAKSATMTLATALTRAKGIRGMTVRTENIDPWAQADWKRIGETTGMRYVLSGTVRERKGKTRIAVHLIETASGLPVSTWLDDVESYSDAGATSLAHISNILGIANKASAPQSGSFVAVEGNASEIGGTKDPSARGYYERGKELFFRNNLPDLARAIDSLQAAIQIDPDYAQPHAMLADACMIRSATGLPEDWLEQADIAAATAMRLAPMLPEAQLAYAENLWQHGQLRGAIDGFLTAYELDPRSARAAAKIGHAYSMVGRPDLAISWFEKATRRDARPLYADNLGDAWTDLGEYEHAEQAYHTAGVFRPDLPVAALGLARLALFRGDYDTARKECEAARTKYKDNPQPLMMAAIIEFFSHHFDKAEIFYREACSASRFRGVDFPGSVRFISALGFMQHLADPEVSEGRSVVEEARALDEKELALAPENPKLLYSLAANHAALGNEDAAIIALRQAVAAGWIDYCSMELDPRFDSVRNLKVFQDTLTQLTTKVQRMRRQQSGRKLAANLSSN